METLSACHNHLYTEVHLLYEFLSVHSVIFFKLDRDRYRRESSLLDCASSKALAVCYCYDMLVTKLPAFVYSALCLCNKLVVVQNTHLGLRSQACE